MPMAPDLSVDPMAGHNDRWAPDPVPSLMAPSSHAGTAPLRRGRPMIATCQPTTDEAGRRAGKLLITDRVRPCEGTS